MKGTIPPRIAKEIYRHIRSFALRMEQLYFTYFRFRTNGFVRTKYNEGDSIPGSNREIEKIKSEFIERYK